MCSSNVPASSMGPSIPSVRVLSKCAQPPPEHYPLQGSSGGIRNFQTWKLYEDLIKMAGPTQDSTTHEVPMCLCRKNYAIELRSHSIRSTIWQVQIPIDKSESREHRKKQSLSRTNQARRFPLRRLSLT